MRVWSAVEDCSRLQSVEGVAEGCAVSSVGGVYRRLFHEEERAIAKKPVFMKLVLMH